MKNTILKFLQENNISLVNEKVLVGVSTGVDSMTLLYALEQLQKENVVQEIIVGHVNHSKRVQSNEEEQYIMNYCSNKHKIYVHHLKKDEITTNFQEEARNKRLNFFEEIMNENNIKYLFLAHHLNDDIETSIMRIARGSNFLGYAGINDVFKYHDKVILRPFLKTLKENIIDYAKANNILYFDDYTNFENNYTRNKIRNNIVNNIFSCFPNFSSKYLEFKNNILMINNILNNIIQEFISKNVIIDNEKIQISLKEFLELNEYLQIEVMFKLLSNYSFSRENILEIIKYFSSSRNIDVLYKGLEIICEYNYGKIYYQAINISNIRMIIDKEGQYIIDENRYLDVYRFTEDDLQEKNANFLTNLNRVWYNSNDFPVILRTRENGDKMNIGTGTRKVKDVLIDLKISRFQRKKSLLLVKENVLAIFGIKKSSLLTRNNNDIMIELKEKNNENA